MRAGDDPPVDVTLYTREGCHLCEAAARNLRALARSGLAFRLSEVDIEGDEDLHRRYMLEIPVVAVAGEVVTREPVDLEAVRAAVLRASRRAR